MNILITGGTGFVGSHMIDYILDNEIDVRIYATKRWMEDTKNLDHIDDERFQFIDCDLIDGMSVQRAIEISKPNKVFHFAAQSFPEVSFKIPVITLQTNVIGTTHLFESIKTKPTYQPQRKTYGNRMQAMPCHEALFNFKKDVIISKFEDLLGVKIIPVPRDIYRPEIKAILINSLR